MIKNFRTEFQSTQRQRKRKYCRNEVEVEEVETQVEQRLWQLKGILKEFEQFSLSGYYYPESDHFPDSNNRKVKIVQT